MRPGVTAAQVDAAARCVLAEAGLADYFVHRTGHGIGLCVHEEPYIVAGNDVALAAGMAFSIEPGSTSRAGGGPHRGHRGGNRGRCPVGQPPAARADGGAGLMSAVPGRLASCRCWI
ncbi:metallopeptidase M24 family protein [Mycobacterium kansasii 732]|nr:metallopeptidase M24 family protein [Mycobacterium kansasii 732]